MPTTVTEKKGRRVHCVKKVASATAVKQVGFVRDAELSYKNLFFYWVRVCRLHCVNEKCSKDFFVSHV